MTNSDVIDTELLQQYYESLGEDGLEMTLKTFDQVIQGYASLLHEAATKKDEAQLRSQAHKVKGACRSVGLKALAIYMENLEKESWGWPTAEQWLVEWADNVIPHRQQIQQWLEQQSH